VADLFRVRFNHLDPSRGRPSLKSLDGSPAPDMPAPLIFVYGATTIAAWIGIVVACALGRAPIGSAPLWLTLPVLLIPVSVTLHLGFAGQQAWTRPLLAVLGLLGAVAAASCGLPLVGASLGLLSAVAVAYLYGSQECRAYYQLLRDNSLVRLSASDLKSREFVSLYTSAGGFVAGAALAYFVAQDGFKSPSGIELNDAVGLVSAMLLVGGLFAFLGHLGGEALVTRRQAPPN
jgi:hypothetical protein